MNITILTLYLTNYQELADITIPNKQEYAARHGYKMHVHVGEYDKTLELSFQREKMTLDYMLANPEVNWVWVLGLDTMVMNHGIKLESFIERYPNKHLLLTKDINSFNNDSMLLENCEWTHRWLKFVLSKHEEYKSDCWGAQRVLIHNEYHPEFANGIQVVPHPSFNSYDYKIYKWTESTPGQFFKGDFLFHAPGMNLRERLDLFRSSYIQDNIIK